MSRIVAFTLVLAVGSVAFAQPGPLDGRDIPSDFAGSTELGVQTNRTGFGDQVLGTGDFTPGSELDGLLLAKDETYLYVGLTGNLERNGHAFVIFIDQMFIVGQHELRAEGVGGPPYAVQTASREFVINSNGTSDPSDDTWSYGANGTILPFEDANYALAVDVFGGTMSVSEYRLQDPAGPPAGTYDPTPDNLGDLPDANLYAIRNFVAQGPINDGNDIFEYHQDLGFEKGGFDDTNTSGVTDVDALLADACTSGFEIAIPRANIGAGLEDFDTICVFVAMMDGAGDWTGTITNQVLPSVTSNGLCDPPTVIGLRPDLTDITVCHSVAVADLPAFNGTCEGVIHPAEYNETSLRETQSCPTPYGDQQWDPDATTVSGGSELNVIWADNDSDFLYLGITGNVEPGGNTLHVFFDVGINGAPEGSHVLGDMAFVPFQAIKGMAGDELPNGPLPGDLPLTYEYAYGINLDGGSPTTWIDCWDLVNTNGCIGGDNYIGSAQRDTGDPTVSGGNNPNGMMLALDNLNDDGVIGCGDGDPCHQETAANVEALARSATLGFEIAIPLADIGLGAVTFPHEIHLWTYITGSGPDGYGSDQGLPSLRNVSSNGAQVQNAGNGPNNYTDPFNPTQYRNFEARGASYTLVQPICYCRDTNCDGFIDALDLGIIKDPTNWLLVPPANTQSDVNRDGFVDSLDLGAIKDPVYWGTSPHPGGCTCSGYTPNYAADCPME